MSCHPPGATYCAACGYPADLGWHVISGEDLLVMLRRVAAGEEPDMVYVEEYVNADREMVEGSDVPDDDNRFGFVWGPASVTRCCSLPGDRRVIQVKTDHKTLDIYVSATGRSVRVFEHGNGEMTLDERQKP